MILPAGHAFVACPAFLVLSNRGERVGWEFKSESVVIGVDEVGVGPLAGPITACAVVLRAGEIEELDDSKKLSSSKIRRVSASVSKLALAWCVTWASVQDVNTLGPNVRFNIMAECVNSVAHKLGGLTDEQLLVVVDGNRTLDVSHQQLALVQADSRCREVAAASVMAKAIRDDYMAVLHREYPMYGWDRNSGYPTEEHIKAIIKYGQSPYHRESYTNNAVERYTNKVRI